MFDRNEIDPNNIDPATGRVFYRWSELEEYRPNGGMWSIPLAADRARFILAAQDLMSIPPDFATAMRRALAEWPKSVAVALTTSGLNQRAWLGHAGTYLATGSPEECTRLGWHRLDPGEQYAANEAADRVIAEWRARNMRKPEPPPSLLLFEDGWDA